MTDVLIRFDNCTLLRNNQAVFENFTWTIRKGENWVITGNTGAGKTSLLQAMRGKLRIRAGHFFYQDSDVQDNAFRAFSRDAAFVFFQDEQIRYRDFYYQQRYHSTETDELPTVRDYLYSPIGNTEVQFDLDNYIFDLNELLDRQLIKLSNGETRKVMIMKALINNPAILLLDNPYIGLDQISRMELNQFIDNLIDRGLHIVLACNVDSFPTQMNHVLMLDCLRIQHTSPLLNAQQRTPHADFVPMPLRFDPPKFDDFKIAVQMSHVNISYDQHHILKQINWTVRKGEKWALSGTNGSGKSMLSSLIFADNPQAYANKIVLFDKTRGVGDNIWDLKERIGYLSPELHTYTIPSDTVLGTIFQSLTEHPFRRRKPTPSDEAHALELLEYFGMSQLANRPMRELSSGQQRVVLLVRVVFKNPSLLLLDEPFQNFDHPLISKAKTLLDHFCVDRTLIFISHHKTEIPSCVTHHAHLNRGELQIH